MKNHRKKLVRIISILVMSLLLMLWIIDGINRISNGNIGFDDAYNAQVSLNIVKEGKYKVDYPDDQIFYNVITTGPTMLLPTAGVYAIMGVSNFTTSLIPFIYSVMVMIFVYLLACNTLKNYEYGVIIAAFVAVVYVIFSTWLIYISSYLLGEVGALAFTIMSVYFMSQIELCKTNCCKVIVESLSGVFLAFSFVTKSSQIFMCIVWIVVLFLKVLLVKEYMIKQYVTSLLGFIGGILVWDIYKTTQYGSYSSVLQWWKNEWKNMFGQTGTTSLFDNFSREKIINRFLYLTNVINVSYWIIIVILIIPIVLFFVYFISRGKKLQRVFSIIMLGIMSDSLLVYYIFFGSDGLTYARRLAVYGEGLMISNIIILTYILLYSVVEKNKYMLTSVLVYSILFASTSAGLAKNNIKSLIDKDKVNVYYVAAKNIARFVDDLPKRAELYGYGWWQAPEVSLLSDREFEDVSCHYSDLEDINYDDAYVIVGGVIQPPTCVWDENFDSYLNQIFETKIIYKDSHFSNSEQYVIYKLIGISANENKIY